MDKVQKPVSSQCYITQSEPFRTNNKKQYRFPNEHCFLEGSQARPACPSDKHNMQMKTNVQYGQQNDYCNENEFQMTEPHNRKSNDCDCLKFVTSLRGGHLNYVPRVPETQATSLL